MKKLAVVADLRRDRYLNSVIPARSMIQLRLLGTPELKNGNGTDLHSVLAHSKHLALLAYLVASRNGAHRRERLISLFWPDLDDVRGRNALSKALHHLRRALGDDLIASTGSETVALNAEVLWCDVTAFESAVAAKNHREAVDLYRRGEFLEGFSLPDCEAFERWIDQQRIRLRREALKSATSLSDEAAAGGNTRDAEQWAALACEIAPYDETAFQRYLVLLKRSGNRSAAIGAYNAFARRIAEDLDSVPSEATRSLLDSVEAAERTAAVADSAAQDESAMAREPSVAAPARTRRWYAIAAVTIVLLSVGGSLVYLRSHNVESQVVAVGLLRNRTGDPKLDPFADMATGSIVQQLAQTGQTDVVDLRRVAASSARTGGAPRATAAQSETLARAAGAGKLVRGDIYSKGDSVLIQMQILSAADGHVIQQLDPVASPAANTYLLLDRLREGVTGAVAALADTLYLPWSTAHSRPPKYAAFQEFMQGLDALVHDGVHPAVDHLKRAAELDTGFVEAKIWLLEQASMLSGEEKYVDSISRAASAQRDRLGAFDQVSLDRELAFLAGHWEAAYGASRRLVQIAPSTPDAQVYLAQSAMATRRYGEALAVLHKIDRSKGWLKDLSQLWQWDLQAHRLNGDAKGGVAEWKQLRARMPDSYAACAAGVPLLAATARESDVDGLISECAAIKGAPRTTDRQLEIAGRIYRGRGLRDAARRALERALVIRSAAAANDRRRLRGVAVLEAELRNWPKAYAVLLHTTDTASIDDEAALGVAAAHVGDNVTAENSLRLIELRGHVERANGQDKMASAFVVLAMGNRERALRLLRESMTAGVAPAWNAWYVRSELDPLRTDPRFQEMIAPQS